MRYTIKSTEIYLNNLCNYNIENLFFDNGFIYFDCNLKEFNDIEVLEIKDNYKNKVKKNIFLWGILFISFTIFCTFYVIMSKNVTEIRFLRPEMASKSIYESVEKYLDRYLCFAFLEKDVTEINKELRSEFYDYEWVSIKKEGTIIYIDVVNNKDIINNDEKEIKGSLYSKYDAVIEGYFIEKGSSEIRLNRSVNKGDLLISGYIKHYNETLEYVEAKGYVIGTVIEEELLNIEKVKTEIVRTGNYQEKTIYVFNGKVLNNPISKYENYETEYKDVFNLFKIFNVKKVIFYELVTNESYYNIDKAKEVALQEIDKKFNEEKRYDFEKIIDKKIISIIENEYVYEICVSVKKKVDITEFIEGK